MIYSSAREYINSLTGRGIKPGLGNITALCKELGDPQNGTKIIHIAGTNGKGSVGAFISRILLEAGYSVCRYLSPAVEDYREIFQYNGEWISENDYAACAEKVKNAVSALEQRGVHPTSFEAETAIAFCYFKQKRCDYAVVEAGMGGALDATNVIEKPVMSVITHISMDHTAFLGRTLEEIAGNKAGIIKNGCPAVSARQSEAAMRVIENKAADNRLIVCGKPEIISCDMEMTQFIYNGAEYRIRQKGLYQTENAALAIEACKLLSVPADKIQKGLYNTVWKFRFEVTSNDPYWIFDGAHNPDGAERLAESLKQYFPGGDIVFITGIFKDKAYRQMARITASLAKKIYTVTPPSERGLDSRILAEEFKKYNKNVIAVGDIETTVRMCESDKCDAVICFGSLSILRQAQKEKELLDNGKSK